MGDNDEPMLALAPGATLQVVADDPSLLLISGAAKGVNTDMLKFNLLKVPGAKNATASQTFPIPSADETRLLIISNLGDVAAGISSLTFSVEKKIETGVSDLSEEENDLETIYYDLKGNRALRPSHGLYIERKGCKSRVVRK